MKDELVDDIVRKFARAAGKYGSLEEKPIETSTKASLLRLVLRRALGFDLVGLQVTVACKLNLGLLNVFGTEYASNARP